MYEDDVYLVSRTLRELCDSRRRGGSLKFLYSVLVVMPSFTIPLVLHSGSNGKIIGYRCVCTWTDIKVNLIKSIWNLELIVDKKYNKAKNNKMRNKRLLVSPMTNQNCVCQHPLQLFEWNFKWLIRLKQTPRKGFITPESQLLVPMLP